MTNEASVPSHRRRRFDARGGDLVQCVPLLLSSGGYGLPLLSSAGTNHAENHCSRAVAHSSTRMSRHRRRIGLLRLAILAGWLICCLSVATSAQDGGSPGPVVEGPSDHELTPRWRASVSKSLAWLATRQDADGSYGSDSHYGKHVGITALAGLAFMSDGHTPGRGKYGLMVKRCVDFILASRSESGLLASETSHGPMYGHGFATLFLAEAYGMAPQPELHEGLRKAIRLIISTQNDEGGWRYQPIKADADISVTICEIMALRAARNAGIYVPKSTIDKAVEYVRQSQNPDGGFRYMLNSGGSAFARSAAGVAALQYAGIYHGSEIGKGLEFLMQFQPPRHQSVGHYFYGHYYAVQAMHAAGGERWKTWWPAIRDELLDKQTAEGYWQGQAGNEYGTAMALIILQMPNRLLPIFQK